MTRQDLVDICRRNYTAQLNLSSSSVNLRSTAIRQAFSALGSLPRPTSSNLVRATLEVPKSIRKGLASGTLMRAGSIVKDAKTGQVVSHLSEIRPAKFARMGKAGIGLFLAAISVAEQVLLNEKLNQIQDLLNAVDSKLDAQNRGLLRKAFEQVSSLPNYHLPENRRQKVFQIQSDLAGASAIYRELYESHWKQIPETIEKFRGAWFTNTDEVEKLRGVSSQILSDLETVVGARLLHAQLNEEIGEPDALAAETADIISFLAVEMGRFDQAFGPDSDIRRHELHKAPSYVSGSIKGEQLTALNIFFDEQHAAFDDLLSRHLLLEAMPPPEVRPPSVLQSIRNRLKGSASS